MKDPVIFDPSAWLRESDLLEHSWNSTSDSCAALLAKEIGADEIVLLKSRLPHLGADVRKADQDLFDVHFTSIAGGIPSNTDRLLSLKLSGKMERRISLNRVSCVVAN